MKAVSYADVESALAQLVARKEPITLSNLRVALGNRGSMSTLSKHLQRWKKEQALDVLPPGPVNPAPEPIMAAVQGVWQQLFDKGQQELLEQQQVFEEQRQEFEAALALAQSQAHNTLAESAELRQKLQATEQQCALLQEQARHSEQQCALAQQQASDAQQAQEQLQQQWEKSYDAMQQWQTQWQQLFDKEQQSWRDQYAQLQQESENLLAQERQRAAVELAQWQSSYEKLQQHYAEAQALNNQLPQIAELSDSLHQQIRLIDAAMLKEQLVSIYQILQKMPRSYDSVSFFKIKGYS